MVHTFYAVGATIAVIGTVTYLDDLMTGHLLPWTRHGLDDLLNAAVYPLWALALVVLLGGAAIRWPERRGRLQAGLVLLGALPWVAYIGVSWARGYPALPSLGDELIALLLLCYPLAIFVAIFRYELLDLEAVVRRSLIYATLTGTLVLAFYAALGAGGALLFLVLGEGTGSIARVSLATVVLGLLFAPLRRAIQRWIDRRFFPERVRLRQRLIDLAAELPALATPERMGQRLVRKLRPIFAVSSVSLYLAEPETAVLLKTAGSGPAESDLPRKLGLDDPAIVLLGRATKPVELGAIVASHTALAGGLGGLGAGVAVPLRGGDKLTGLLLLAEKTTRRRFTREEIELLTLIAQQAGTAFDNARLHRRATHEELTGLLRREEILDMLRGELERAVRYRRPLGVALVDIDRFKSINDRFGHLEGDRVLREVAASLSGMVRSSDGVGRYGGEEFLCVFPETDPGAAAALAEKLRHAVESLVLFTEDGKRIGVTASIGLSSLQGEATGPDLLRRLVAAADAALYRAKGAGRNRVETT
jgi:diguanylate cyclase (GGDEF)-like protein